jgi:hypothetical protein
MDLFNSFNPAINKVLNIADVSGSASDTQKIVGGLLKLVLVLYAGSIAPHLPDEIAKWFTYPAFKIFVLALIVYTANQDPALSILIAVAFYSTLNVLAGKQMFEAFGEKKRNGN